MSIFYVAWWNLENLFDEENPRRSAHRQGLPRDRRRHRGLDAAAAGPQGRPAGLGDRADERRRRDRTCWGCARSRTASSSTCSSPPSRRGCRGAATGSCTPTPTTPAASTSRSCTTRPVQRAARRDVLPRGDAPQRHPRDRAGQLPHRPGDGPGRCSATTGRPAAAASSSRPGTGHRRRDPRLLPPARARRSTGPTTPALVMGDFNDEPFDTSLVIHALSTRQRQSVLNGDTPAAVEPDVAGDRRHRPTAPSTSTTSPTCSTSSWSTRTWPVDTAPIRADADRSRSSASRARPHRRVPRPIPFGGMGKPINEDGFSDHFPIGLTVEET